MTKVLWKNFLGFLATFTVWASVTLAAPILPEEGNYGSSSNACKFTIHHTPNTDSPFLLEFDRGCSIAGEVSRLTQYDETQYISETVVENGKNYIFYIQPLTPTKFLRTLYELKNNEWTFVERLMFMKN